MVLSAFFLSFPSFGHMTSSFMILPVCNLAHSAKKEISIQMSLNTDMGGHDLNEIFLCNQVNLKSTLF